MKIPAPAEDDFIAFASDLLIWGQQSSHRAARKSVV